MHGITIGTLNREWAPLHGLSGRSVLRFVVTGTKGRGGSRGRGACGVVSGAGLHVLGLPYGIRDMRTLLFLCPRGASGKPAGPALQCQRDGVKTKWDEMQYQPVFAPRFTPIKSSCSILTAAHGAAG